MGVQVLADLIDQVIDVEVLDVNEVENDGTILFRCEPTDTALWSLEVIVSAACQNGQRVVARAGQFIGSLEFVLSVEASAMAAVTRKLQALLKESGSI